MKLHRTQKAFRDSTATYRGYVGGRGSGKSFVGAYDLIRRAKRDRLYLVASPTYDMLRDSTLRTFLQIGRELGVVRSQDVRRAPPSVSLTTGAEILFRSADDPEKLRGPNLTGVWLDEASLMKRDAYDIAIACLRERGETGWLSATFTPKGLGHWTYDIFGKNKPGTEIFHSATRDNPFNAPEFEASVRAQYEGTRLAAQELDGRFVSLEGAEWPAEFFDGIFFDHFPTRDGFPPDIIARVLALDPSKGRADKSGDYSAFVELAVDREWTLWVDADLDNSRPVEAKQGQSIVGDGLELYRVFQPDAVICETNGFQELVAQAMVREAQNRKIMLPMYTKNNTEPKVTRIRSLTPYLAQKRLRVKNTPGGRMLVQQLRDFPLADHDDGPDALKLGEEMASLLIHGRNERSPEAMR